MKEKIYTIPINEAYEEDSECPLCLIERRLEAEAAEYELGAAMMEPDHREISNKKGFCNKHAAMLYEKQNKLPLALVMDTHLEEVRKRVSAMKNVKSGGFLKRPEKNTASDIVNSCVICDKIEHTMDRYCKVLAEMWKTEPEFREKVEKSKGFCLKHFERLYASCDNTEFLKALAEKEEAELLRIQEDIHKFTLKFDYRNKDMEWGTAKDAPKRTVEKIFGYINDEKEG